MHFPENLKYTADHEWVSSEGRVGITEFAQDSLGDVVFVELPEVGREVKAGDAVGVIESVKSVSDLYSPLGGRVSTVNHILNERPELVNQDPYGDGWIYQLEEIKPGELLSASDYQKQVEGE